MQKVETGADVNAKEKNLGWTPLYLAARENNKGVAELLILRGADVNVKDKYGPIMESTN